MNFIYCTQLSKNRVEASIDIYIKKQRSYLKREDYIGHFNFHKILIINERNNILIPTLLFPFDVPKSNFPFSYALAKYFFPFPVTQT
jgi:hypothetical protein